MPSPARNGDDPFDALGVEPAFDLDDEAVRRAWLARSAASHPDVIGADSMERDAEQLAADLNEARRVLADPERRAGALLRRLGGPTESQDKSLPPELLMEYMEAREELEAAQASNDASRLESSRAWAHERRAAHIRTCSRLFADALADPNPDPETLRAIRTELNAWRYAERMLEQIDEIHP